MEQLVIGVPARGEGGTIAQLADALELGCARLGEVTRCELVLAHQPAGDDTLLRWQSRRSRLANRVLHAPEGVVGKGRNVKMLIDNARDVGSHLLLVDADLGSYPPSNVAEFAHPDRLARGGVVLPLWVRPRGEGNSTDFVASPLLFAAYGARVRQPLAGQMLLTRSFLETIDVDRLPDGYGIDVALTMHALDEGRPVDQVVLRFPEHRGGANSHQIMTAVAATMLQRLADGQARDRRDVTWPDGWWRGQVDPPASRRSLRTLIERLAPAEEEGLWRELWEAPPDAVRDLWCDVVASAVRQARAGAPLGPVVEAMVWPFLVHAEYRRRVDPALGGAEAYVGELGTRLAAMI